MNGPSGGCPDVAPAQRIRSQVVAGDLVGGPPASVAVVGHFTGPAGAYYAGPVKVKIERKYTRAARGGVGAAKTAGNYAASLYPALQAQQKGYTQLVWTDGVSHEFIEESGTMNIMFMVGDTLVTPSLTDSILPGITRLSVLELAKEWGLKVEERPVTVSEIEQAAKAGDLKDAFGVGTAVTISQFHSLGFEDSDYELPPKEERVISNKMLQTLNDIKLGKAKDEHGWIYKI
jgi:branched-chain amino acid aminotransferase